MKKNEMTWQVMLIEAVGIVSAIAGYRSITGSRSTSIR